jgi:WhiB family redox-sensing transcriptional regulator
MDASWAQYAACRQPGTDPELFFPVSESGPAARQIAAAKAVCARCPAAAECRDWALRAGEPAGIWAALPPRNAARCGGPGSRGRSPPGTAGRRPRRDRPGATGPPAPA